MFLKMYIKMNQSSCPGNYYGSRMLSFGSSVSLRDSCMKDLVPRVVLWGTWGGTFKRWDQAGHFKVIMGMSLKRL